MLGTTITVNTGTIADPVEKVIPLINNDGYSGEYQLKESDRVHTVIVRHSADKQLVNGQKMDRHVVTYRQFELPTEIYPQGRLKETYTVIRVPASMPFDDLDDVCRGAISIVNDSAVRTKVINWES
jgi:hypothetical protein